MQICVLTESRKNNQRHGNCYHSNSQCIALVLMRYVLGQN
jgi:hypothetical protein